VAIADAMAGHASASLVRGETFGICDRLAGRDRAGGAVAQLLGQLENREPVA
jgi:hypothetical protein